MFDISSKNFLRYQEDVRNHTISTIAEYERVLEVITSANQAKQVEMEQALKLLFGGGLNGKGNEEKGEEASEEAASSSSKLSTKDSKIILGKRKRKSSSATSITLGAKDSNLSIELKLTGNSYFKNQFFFKNFNL